MLKVMLVDDKTAIVDGLEFLIDWNSLGYEVAAKATSANQAIELATNNVFDLIVTDIRMPNMNGLEMIEQLMSINAKMKYILISAYSEFEYAKRAIDRQISGYILKPINDKELTDILKRVKEEIEKEKKYAAFMTKESGILDQSSNEALSDDENVKDFDRLSGLVKKVIKYTESHYVNCDLNLNYLASVFFVTPSYIGRMFKKDMGMSFSDYLLKLRINKAKEILITTDIPIYEVAEMVGFSDANYFCMKFQSIVGMPATHYRKMRTGKG